MSQPNPTIQLRLRPAINHGAYHVVFNPLLLDWFDFYTINLPPAEPMPTTEQLIEMLNKNAIHSPRDLLFEFRVKPL